MPEFTDADPRASDWVKKTWDIASLGDDPDELERTFGPHWPMSTAARLATDLPPAVAEAARRYWDERGVDPHDWDAPLPADFEIRESW